MRAFANDDGFFEDVCCFLEIQRPYCFHRIIFGMFIACLIFLLFEGLTVIFC